MRMEPMDDLMQGLMGDFLDESTGLLTQLNGHLLQFDNWAKGEPGQRFAGPASGIAERHVPRRP